MRKGILLIAILSLILSVVACEDNEAGTPENVLKNRELNITSELISNNFVGNGAQWGGYDMVPAWLETETLSEADWNTLFHRIDYMRPPFLRIMTTAEWSYDDGGDYNETKKTVSLFKMLDYAQDRHIEISYGEWGHHYTDGNIGNINMEWIANSVKFLNHLVNEKGYSCIKTINIINEPNGYWASTEGSYDIYRDVQLAYLAEMENYELSSVKLMGPDVAIFDNTNETNWITKAAQDLDEHVGLYDIHVYPKQQIVRNGDYTSMLQAYRDATPVDKRIVLGEIGFKYTEVDADLKERNEAAIEADPFAGDDSNMMIYEAFYGVDMADAIIQSMRAGFSGALVWDMDDAMYNSPDNGDYQTDKLKRWGFWNILGEEHCGTPEDEAIRPFFYTVSLLCRYFPAGCNIYNIELPDKKGVRAIMAEKDGKYTIAIVNSHYVSYPIVLKADNIGSVVLDKYSYRSNSDGSYIGTTDENGFASPLEEAVNINLTDGLELTLEGESFVLYTNMD